MQGRRPGPHLRECRYLAQFRPAIIAMDSWKFGVYREEFGVDMLPHQELPGKYGIRVGEAVPSDELSSDKVYSFVFCFSAQNARGAVSGSCRRLRLGHRRAEPPSGAGKLRRSRSAHRRSPPSAGRSDGGAGSVRQDLGS